MGGLVNLKSGDPIAIGFKYRGLPRAGAWSLGFVARHRLGLFRSGEKSRLLRTPATAQR
jgi:hypothetical protein